MGVSGGRKRRCTEGTSIGDSTLVHSESSKEEKNEVDGSLRCHCYETE